MPLTFMGGYPQHLRVVVRDLLRDNGDEILMPNDLDKEIDEAWETDQRLQIRSLKDAYRLGFYRGSGSGNGIVYGMGPIDNTPAANMIPTDDVLSKSYRRTDSELS